VGTKLGRYECTTALHDSDLWLAGTSGRHVVLRILTAEQVADPKFVRMSDAWGNGDLHQASIAKIDGIAEDQGTHYLATEYVHGESLVQLLARVDDRGKQIPLQHVLAIMIAAAEAMHHVHELGIHCAISPAQVLLGYDGTVKLDLGRVGAPPHMSYRSPEHAAGIATDRRSDVFALGIVMYECVTLNRLFGDGPGPVAKPSTLRRGLPSEIEKIVMRMLASEPPDRYVNAGELRAALTQFASKAGMKLGGDPFAAYMKQMFEKRVEPWLPGGTASTASRAFGRDFQEHSTVENVTQVAAIGTEDPTGNVAPLNGGSTPATVKGTLPSIDPTEETKLPEAEIPDETVVSPPPIVSKVAKPPPLPSQVAPERAESERPDSEELRVPTMITSPPPPPIIIASTRSVETRDSTAVVKPLPPPGAAPRARRPSTAKTNAAASPIEVADVRETEVIAAARPSRKKLLIGVSVAVAIAIPLVIVLWPSSVTRKVAQQPIVEPAPAVERTGPIAAGPDPSEAEPTPTEPPAEPVPTDPAPTEPAPTEPAPTAIEPPSEPGEPKPSVFVPRVDSGSATEPPKPKKPKAKTNKAKAKAKVAAKPKPRVAAKAKSSKKPATKRPKGPTYDPDSLFLKKK